MIEYYVCGTTRKGEVLPRHHGMTTLCIQSVLNHYKVMCPDCVHINIDIALDDTFVLRAKFK